MEAKGVVGCSSGQLLSRVVAEDANSASCLVLQGRANNDDIPRACDNDLLGDLEATNAERVGYSAGADKNPR